MKAVLFDLDNTLYPEIEFVKSGFRTVARYLISRYDLNEESLLAQMLEILQKDGRGKVFNILLHNLGLYQEEMVKLLVYIYRSHKPMIRLYGDSMATIDYLKRCSMCLGILTDGMASVQRSKITALGLESFIDAIICTDELGRECCKPSVVPYKIALDLFDASPSHAAYIGDDPTKDFLGPNSMGMLTIQLKRDMHHSSITNAISEPASAKFVVRRLGDILPIIEGKRNA